MVQYLRDQVIACLCQWLRTQAWSLFEFLGWGGIVAIVMGLFLLFAICSRFSATLGRPLPMLLASAVIAGGLYSMVMGWNKPASVGVVARKAPAQASPMVMPPLLLADAAPADLPAVLPDPVRPAITAPVSPLHESPVPHAPTHHNGHGQAAHPAVSGHHAGINPTASMPPPRVSASSHAPPASGGTVHVAVASTPAASTSAATSAAKATRPAKPAKPAQATVSATSGGITSPSPAAPVPSAPSPSRQAQALAARRALFRRQQAVADGVDVAFGNLMQPHYTGSHAASPHPVAGNHSAGVHPAGHPGAMHHPNGRH